MSLRYVSRLVYGGARRVMQQGMKDLQASKCDSTAALKSIRDSNKGRRLSGAIDTSSTGFQAAAKGEKLKQAEESLRTVMYLSCWGPN